MWKLGFEPKKREENDTSPGDVAIFALKVQSRRSSLLKSRTDFDLFLAMFWNATLRDLKYLKKKKI